MDNALRRVTLFDLRTGTFKRSFPLLAGWLPNLTIQGSSIIAGYLDSDLRSAIVEFSPNGDRVTSEGVVPGLFSRHPQLIAGFGAVYFTRSGSDTYAAFEVSQSVFHWKRGARTGDELPIPAVRRKGVKPANIEALLNDPSKYETIAFDRSIPYGLAFIAPGRLALVTLDGTLNTKGGLSGTYFVTIIDLSRRRACADLEVPAPHDPRPLLAFSGDTLVVVQQGADPAGQPASAIRRFRIVTDGCEWL